MLGGVAVYVQLSSDGVVCKSRRLSPSPAAREATSVPIFDTSRNGVSPNAQRCYFRYDFDREYCFEALKRLLARNDRIAVVVILN